MKRPAGVWLVLAGGILITFSSAAHAFGGWPGLAAMLALGVLALVAFAELPRAGGALVIGAL